MQILLSSNENISLDLPGQRYNVSPCLIKISVPYSFHVNVTVGNIFMFKGANSAGCMLGGLAFTENLKSHYKKSYNW